jgi:hypothetical protein
MHKIIISIALITLASTAMVGAASAKPGGGIITKMPIPGNGPIIQQQPGMPGMPGNGGASYGGETTSPGDAFSPDAGAQTCDGVIKYHFDDGVLVPFCIL